MLPDVRLHPNSIECMLAKKSQPCLYCLWVTVLDLDESAESDALKILLALFVNKVASRDGPAFDDARKGNGARDGEVEVVSCANGEIGKEFYIVDTVGSQLEVTDGEAIFRFPPEWSEVDGLHASR